MIGERQNLDVRKGLPSRNGSRDQIIDLNGNKKAANHLKYDLAKRTDSRSKKNVFFNSRDFKINTDSESSNGNDGRTASTGTKTGLLSALNSTSSACNSSFSLSPNSPLYQYRSHRSASAHPTICVANGTLQSSYDRPRKLVRRSRLSSRESVNESENHVASSSPLRNGKTVEHFNLRSSSVNSYDSDESNTCSPKSRCRPISQYLSPEEVASVTQRIEHNKQVWNQFSNHVKHIDDSTGLVSQYPLKTFGSSTVFQRVMNDLYGNAEYGKSGEFMKLGGRNIAAYASKFIAGARRVKARSDEQNDEEKKDSNCMEYKPSKETVENSQRGWRILRHHVQEMAAEKRMSRSTLSWNMIAHTLRGLTNMERTRFELYQKYGLVPIVLSDGTTIQENTMLSERARSAMASKSNSNSNSNSATLTRYQTPSTTTRRPSVYKAIGAFKGTGLKTEANSTL